MRVFVDSRNRTALSSGSSSFVVSLPRPIARIKRVQLLNLMLPNTVYNISASNNTIPFVVGVNTLTATLPVGNYTSDSLAAAVATALTSAANGTGVTFTASVSATTGQMTITASSGTFQLLFSQSGTPWRELGFTNTNTSTAASLTGPNVVQISLPNFLFINVSEFSGSNNYIATSTQTTATFYAPLSTNGFNISQFDERDFHQVLVFSPSISGISNLTVNVQDGNGNPVSLNGADWSMLLEIETEQNY